MLFITFINATVTLGENGSLRREHEENYCNHVQWTWNLLVFNWLLQIQGHGLQSPTASRYLQSNFDTSRQQKKNSIKTEPMWHHFVIEWGHLHYWVQIHMKPKLIREITRDKKQKFRNFCTNSDIIVPKQHRHSAVFLKSRNKTRIQPVANHHANRRWVLLIDADWFQHVGSLSAFINQTANRPLPVCLRVIAVSLSWTTSVWRKVAWLTRRWGVVTETNTKKIQSNQRVTAVFF